MSTAVSSSPKRRGINLLTALLLAAVGQVGAATDQAASATSAAHEQGRALYNYRCYFCHGYSGDARTLTSSFLDPSPRDFTRGTIPRERMLAAVRDGKPGTAMHGFSRVLTATEIELVVDFVRDEFMLAGRPNTRYHTAANGWPDHERYRHAFPFATGEIPLDRDWQELSPEQVRGKRLYLSTCISCHDRSRVLQDGEIWRKESISFPRNRYSHRQPDAISGASIYAQHDRIPDDPNLSPIALQGRQLWEQNCAFCHASDGTGENWIGSFLERAPRDLTDAGFMRGLTRDGLRQRIRDGLPGTSMPAWKSVLDEAEIEAIVEYIHLAFHPLGGAHDSRN